ncbi:MAG: DUF3419 family protein [Bdellovibrionota bacterium]
MAQEYFSDLNYTLSNEDTRVEYQLLPEKTDIVFSIAGSGARCIPLIAREPNHLHIIDMSPAQIHLCELRFEAMRQLDYEQWLFFLGYRGGLQKGNDHGDSRIELFNQLNLKPETKAYWNERKTGWEKRGFILLGRWESHFQKLGVIFRDYLQCDFSFLFKAQSLEEQMLLYKKSWPHLRWKSFLRILASEYVFNKYLYKGHFSGQANHRTEHRPPYQFIWEEFERVFKTQLVRKNYFMQILFLGEIRYEEGLPLEAHENIFHKSKKSNTKIHYHIGNLLDILPTEPFDFISLSDTISYLPTDEANKILQKLHKDTKKSSCVVIRSFMKAPTEIDQKGWSRLAEKETWAHQMDGTSVYKFHIFKKTI